MSISGFTNTQISHFLLSAVIIILAVFIFHSGKKKLGIILLFTGALILGFFICSLDHFLLLWDEQFHALVAKNMLVDPLKPTLYITPVLDYDYRNWTANHVWLHKQPLFLWQIALSLKFFGINALSVRMPGIVMHAILVVFIYRIGKISVSANAGFYGALFFSVASYPLELIAGRHATDHNDIAFLFYFTATFWAWFEYRESNKSYWLIVIGLLAGCAVLVKWLVGLMVFGVWTLAIWIGDKSNRLKIKSYFPIVIAFVISLLVFIPWQLFILYKYTLEAKHEYAYNTSHFFEALEDHGESLWFHFNAISELYGAGILIPFLLLAGVVILFKQTSKREYRLAILFPIIFTYAFFTIAATKMASFCLIACPFLFLGLGALMDATMHLVRSKIKLVLVEKTLRTAVLIAICIYFIDVPRIINYHTEWDPQGHCSRKEELDQMAFLENLKHITGDEEYVVFNTGIKPKGNITTMFYTSSIAYEFIPDSIQVQKVKNKNYKIAICTKDSVPDFIMNDDEIVKISP